MEALLWRLITPIYQRGFNFFVLIERFIIFSKDMLRYTESGHLGYNLFVSLCVRLVAMSNGANSVPVALSTLAPCDVRFPAWMTFLRHPFFTFARCLLTACPTNSIVRLLSERGFKNTRIWPRGVDHDVFAPVRRSHCVRKSYGIPGAAISSTVVASLPTSSTSERRATTGGSGPLEDPVVVLSVGRMYVRLGLSLLYSISLLAHARRTLFF